MWRKAGLSRGSAAVDQAGLQAPGDTGVDAKQWDLSLLARYDQPAPRYTSYPTAPHFSSDFGEREYRENLAAGSTEHLVSIAPLSLYLHIPFCDNICYYCACNKIVTKDRERAQQYLEYLQKEIALQSDLVGRRRLVTQLHLGGGTPTFLDGAQLTALMYSLGMHFKLTDAEDREYSIEIDPRTVDTDRLALLRGLGFNRLSFGIQDFDPRVQEAINRRQSFASVRELTEAARLYGFKSLSFDLIYGLPYQNEQTINSTLDQVLELSPDRIAFYNYAHLPERFSSQRAIDRLTLPNGEEKLRMLANAAARLENAGYRFIGMDHFVKPSDELYLAQQQGSLQRNFQGYSIAKARDLLAMGVSAISCMQDAFAQNYTTLEDYYAALDQGHLPIARGHRLDQDDILRREVIMQLICNLKLDFHAIEQQYGVVFREYFADALVALEALQEDGLIAVSETGLQVTELGRPLLRVLCMPFDKYLRQNQQSGHPTRYSRAV